MNNKKVVIVIVNWNAYNDTSECLDSLKEIIYPNYQIVIVDNNSSDGSEEKLRQKYPDHKIIEAGSNLGFASGVNLGIEYAKIQDADYVLLLNNDTTVDKNFLDKMVEAAQKDDRAGLVGGKIYYMDEKDKLWSYGGAFDVNSGMAKHFVTLDKAKHKIKKSERVYIQACLMLIKRECLEDVGLFTEKFFHLGEDVEYCLRVQKNGWKLIFAQDAIIYHKASASMKFLSPIYNYYEQRNRLYIVKDYHEYNTSLDALINILTISARILFTMFFMTRPKDIPSNIKHIILGICDFKNGVFGKRL